MYIKSIVLDGFKSYGNRVEITGFDPEFNAITGLNGTGKSNILDSICFVLGITNLSNVRAGSLQELIYKHGQAGITKATVSITFDNRDKSQCPIGYENHNEITVTRQVVMGGKNKYLINGVNVQNKRVSDLFCSVQLNVNNPHFLIMQGRITKVLNMKPPEILSMVEEAAGTRMYEAKKQTAQKTIEKKDAKLRELNDIIKEDIAPKLQKLQDERSQFQEYQKVVRELESLTRLNVAWRYVTAEQSTKEADERVTKVKEDIESKKQNIEENKKECKQIDVQMKDLHKKLEEESGSILKELEEELATCEKTEATAASAYKAAKETLSGQEKKARLLDKALADDRAALLAKTKMVDDVSSTFEKLKSASEESEAALSAAQQKFLAVSSGQEDASDSLQEQLMAAREEASETSTRVTQSTMEMNHCSERLNKMEKDFKSSSAQYEKDQQLIARQKAVVDQLKEELSRMNFDEAHYNSLKETCRSLQQSVRSQRDTVDRLRSKLHRCDFRYTDPERGFDRSRVSGTVCKLISVRDPRFCTALEIAAGGRLYNVIVDTNVTSKLLLQKGNLETRTTIIPLNKILSGQVIDNRTLRKAQEIGGGADNVQLALDLITYPAHVRAAMLWVFGQTLVCRDLDTARRVTFHRNVRKRCVTLDGDLCDPGGTLTGGSKIKGTPMLVQVKQLKDEENKLQQLNDEFQRVTGELNSMQQTADAYMQLQNKYEITRHELDAVSARVAATAPAQLYEDILALRQSVKKYTDSIEEDMKKLKIEEEKASELQAKVDDIKGHREREFKKAEEALKKAKIEAEKHSSSWKLREQEFETLQLEVSELSAAVAGSDEQLASCRAAAAAAEEELDTAAKELEASKEAVKELQSRIKRQKTEISSKNTDIAKLLQKKESLNKKNSELELAIQELQYKIKELQQEAQECAKRIKTLEESHPWISTEKQYFGLAGGAFDLAARQAHTSSQRLQQMSDKKERLARGLNARAHTLLAKEEEQYQDVMRKKKIVEMDRAKLVEVMAELDEKKKQTLIGACEQVNKDFGSIFSTLLPGALAKLTAVKGQSVLDGLEIKVGFNGTWKESLGELSGGQRSLVALSLVLAMLLFKPAPLYILDEVDAALDLSHTQNIGNMLKEHFKASQFIIVSLKDGMFNNANVLFRTKFVDGMSSVQRTVNARK